MFLAVFVAVIVGLVLEPLPGAAVGLIGVTVAAVGGLVATDAHENTVWALSGFANDTVWLIFAAYLMWIAFASTCVTSSLFATALAPNLLTTSIFAKLSNVKISWSDWFMGIAPLGIVLLLLVPLLTYIVYPPTIKRGDDVAVWTSGELGRLGRTSVREYLMGALALTALALWIFGGAFIGATIVALAVVSAMLISKIITWKQLIGNSAGWSVFVWSGRSSHSPTGWKKPGCCTRSA